MNRPPVNKPGRAEVPTAELVYSHIVREMIAGRLGPGDVVSEVHLAQVLRVSRTPVHLAVRELVKDGLVTQRPNYRPEVRRFSAADLDEIFEMRQLLEGHAVALAARRIDRHSLAELRDGADYVRRARGSAARLGRWIAFDQAFHARIATSCGLPRLTADIVRYHMLHRALNNECLSADQVPQALAEHDAILDALEARNPSLARDAMTIHLREWQTHYVQALLRRERDRADLPVR